MNQEDIEQMAALLLEPMTDVQKTQWNAMQQAIVLGTGAYTLGMRQGRMIGKSITQGHIGTVNRFKIIESPPLVFHVFHHTKGYMAVKLRAMIPDHCYYLIGKEWYQKGRGKTKRIPLSKVPKAHRLFLMVNQIDQPME